jgi:hypothetical protein
MIGGLLHGQGLVGGLHEFFGKKQNELLANVLIVFFVFLTFFAFRELGRVLGEGRIRKLFFSEQRPSEPTDPKAG